MSSVADKSSKVPAEKSPVAADGRAEPSTRRHYDARASRRALLDAAGALFDERGYEAATVREIGERAGVDAALIARYFGGKEGLYLAALAQHEGSGHIPADPARALVHMLTRAEQRGSGPIGLAMVSPTLTDAMREQVREIVHRYAVAPIAAELASAPAGESRDAPATGAPAELRATPAADGQAGAEPGAAPAAGVAAGAELRAELLVAIATGVSLIRAGGTLPALAGAPLEDVLAVLAPLVDALRASS